MPFLGASRFLMTYSPDRLADAPLPPALRLAPHKELEEEEACAGVSVQQREHTCARCVGIVCVFPSGVSVTNPLSSSSYLVTFFRLDFYSCFFFFFFSCGR